MYTFLHYQNIIELALDLKYSVFYIFHVKVF